jgi:hypothetical protein
MRGVAGMKKSGSQKSKSPSQLIDARIRELDDWRGQMLGRLRTLARPSGCFRLTNGVTAVSMAQSNLDRCVRRRLYKRVLSAVAER